MRKQTFIKIAAVAFAAGAAMPAMAQSSASGSAGLGVDYTALVSAGATGTPGVALPQSSSPPSTVGSPIAGLARHFSRPKPGK